MNEREAEELVQRLWRTTDLPLTHGNLARASGLPSRDVEHALRGLMRSGKVDMDMTPAGEICWVVPDVPRKAATTAIARPTPVATQATPAPLVAVEPPPAPAVSVAVPGVGVKLSLGLDPRRKSMLLSAGMGLLFGPFGWLYAAPWRECAAAIAAYVCLTLLLPRFLMGPLLGLVHPTCGVLAMLYAWHYNRGMERTPLLFPRARKGRER